jgi:methionyl-tRNA formyltransferase
MRNTAGRNPFGRLSFDDSLLMPLRLIFMGTPDFAVPTLRKIVGDHEVVAVYTRAPKPAGRRGLELTPSPVEREARRLGLSVLTPGTLRDAAAAEAFRTHRADAAVVVAYGLILPKPILEAVPLGCFNVHASLLPRWRGAAPINRAIMAGDAETGVTVMQMEAGLDTGPIAMFQKVPIGLDMTAGELRGQLAEFGADLMAYALGDIERGRLAPKPQPETGVTYARKIDRNETRIVWQGPWWWVHNHIRGLSPFPGAWFELAIDGKPVRVKVLRTTEGTDSGPPGTLLDDRLTIACGEGAVRIVELQRAGGKVMQADEFLRGAPLKPGTQFD